jgi:electron-transferring-flavoprotein dehydrogenase
LTSLEEYYAGPGGEKVALLRKECVEKGTNLHDALMDAAGWPKVELDGKLLVSHQDALLMGGKVQATGGYADHVTVLDPSKCAACETKVCVGMCSGQALSMPEKQGPPAFDREKCVTAACAFGTASSPWTRLGTPQPRVQAGSAFP